MPSVGPFAAPKNTGRSWGRNQSQGEGEWIWKDDDDYYEDEEEWWSATLTGTDCSMELLTQRTLGSALNTKFKNMSLL